MDHANDLTGLNLPLTPRSAKHGKAASVHGEREAGRRRVRQSNRRRCGGGNHLLPFALSRRSGIEAQGCMGVGTQRGAPPRAIHFRKKQRKEEGTASRSSCSASSGSRDRDRKLGERVEGGGGSGVYSHALASRKDRRSDVQRTVISGIMVVAEMFPCATRALAASSNAARASIAARSGRYRSQVCGGAGMAAWVWLRAMNG